MLSPDFVVEQLAPMAVEPLLVIALAMPARKRLYYPIDYPHPSIPLPIGEMGQQLSAEFGQPFNTAIIKRYDHVYPSEAYRPHRDPECFARRLAMLSLDNEAELTLYGDDYIVPVQCTAGTRVVCRADLKHKVTPPQLPGFRHFVFFGYDDTKAAATDIIAT
jgi:hypothetical protein